MKRTLFITLVVILLIVSAACTSSNDTSHTTSSNEPPPEGAQYTNILLMGSMDKNFSNENSSTYALTHILITLDPNKRVIKFTTFPYNLAVDVETEDGTQTMQLQFVCSQFGEKGTLEALEKNFGIDIDYWVLMNMQGVVDIVDALEGIKIDIQSLSLNEASKHVVDILGLVWEEVKQTGQQTLTGVQTAGYFVDTVPESENWMEEEEQKFRDRHVNIINGVLASIRLLGLESDDLLTIATNVEANYITSLPVDQWQQIADTALYCLQNDALFHHVPEVITAVELDNGWKAIGYDPDTDVTAVQAFLLK